jgi:MtN3 and saliva related transmembrane protein
MHIMDLTSFIGSAATCASVLSFFPQALKIAKTRDKSGISTKMYAITVAAFAMWTAYGIMLQAYPVIIANGLCLLLSGFILGMKLASAGSKSRIAGQTDPAI